MALPPRHEGTRFPARCATCVSVTPRPQATNAPPSSSFSNCPTRTSRVICWREMSHPIRATPPCAGTSCNRIELIPSRFAARAWFAWLLLACAVTVVCRDAAVACAHRHLRAPSPRQACVALRAFVLLTGPRAVRAIEWDEAGELHRLPGATLAPHPADTRARIVPAGPAVLGIAVRNAGGDRDPCWWRRRPVRHVPSGASAGVSTGTCAGVPGAPGRPADTIRPKV